MNHQPNQKPEPNIAPELDDDLRAELAAFLTPRLAEIKAGKFSEKSVNEIFEEVYEEPCTPRPACARRDR